MPDEVIAERVWQTLHHAAPPVHSQTRVGERWRKLWRACFCIPLFASIGAAVFVVREAFLSPADDHAPPDQRLQLASYSSPLFAGSGSAWPHASWELSVARENNGRKGLHEIAWFPASAAQKAPPLQVGSMVRLFIRSRTPTYGAPQVDVSFDDHSKVEALPAETEITAGGVLELSLTVPSRCGILNVALHPGPDPHVDEHASAAKSCDWKIPVGTQSVSLPSLLAETHTAHSR